MIMKKLITVVLAAMGCLAAKAQIPKPDPDTTAKHFLIVASIGNLQEASAGQLTVQKARRADVKSFGEMMVRDHGDAEQNESCRKVRGEMRGVGVKENCREQSPPFASGNGVAVHHAERFQRGNS